MRTRVRKRLGKKKEFQVAKAQEIPEVVNYPEHKKMWVRLELQFV